MKMGLNFDLSQLLKPRFLDAAFALIPTSILLVGCWRFRPEIVRLYLDSDVTDHLIPAAAFCGALFACGAIIQFIANGVTLTLFAAGNFSARALLNRWTRSNWLVAPWNDTAFRILASEFLLNAAPRIFVAPEAYGVEAAIEIVARASGVTADKLEEFRAELKKNNMAEMLKIASALGQATEEDLNNRWCDCFDSLTELFPLDWSNIIPGLQLIVLPLSTCLALSGIKMLGKIGSDWIALFFTLALLSTLASSIIGALLYLYYASGARIKAELIREIRKVSAPRMLQEG